MLCRFSAVGSFIEICGAVRRSVGPASLFFRPFYPSACPAGALPAPVHVHFVATSTFHSRLCVYRVPPRCRIVQFAVGPCPCILLDVHSPRCRSLSRPCVTPVCFFRPTLQLLAHRSRGFGWSISDSVFLAYTL